MLDTPEEQNARIALLQNYSSQLISHAALLVSTLLIVLGLVQIKLRFFGILSILWWAFFFLFGCGSIYVLGRLFYYSILSNLVLKVCFASENIENPKLLNRVRYGVRKEFNSLAKKRFDIWLIKSLFDKKIIIWLFGSLIVGFLLGTIGFFFNFHVIVESLTSSFK